MTEEGIGAEEEEAEARKNERRWWRGWEGEWDVGAQVVLY